MEVLEAALIDASGRAGLEDLVEICAIGKMGLCRVGPPAKRPVDRHQRQFREPLGTFRSDLWLGGTIEVARGDFLAFLRVEVLQIGFRHLARPRTSSDSE